MMACTKLSVSNALFLAVLHDSEFLFTLCTMHKMKKVVIKKIIEEMHKKMRISSLFFCAFALKYKLGCFCAGK